MFSKHNKTTASIIYNSGNKLYTNCTNVWYRNNGNDVIGMVEWCPYGEFIDYCLYRNLTIKISILPLVI